MPALQLTTEATHTPRRRRWVWLVVVVVLVALIAVFFILMQRGVSWRDQVEIVDAIQPEPNRLELFVDTCGAEPELELLREDSQRVEVAVVSTHTFGGSGGSDCLDVVSIRLQEPLADRPLIDNTSGNEVMVRDG